MPDLASMRARNAARWDNAVLTRASEFTPVAARLAAPAAKARYQAIEAKTGVPWFFIAVTHQRESSQDWSRSLAQGDPWNKVSTHVPKGRGPFASFEDAAVDALKNCAPYAAKNTDWSVGGLLTMLERYNGLGYFNRGLPSPYIWSGTDQYVKGTYVADGVFDTNAVDKQLGCAGLILADDGDRSFDPVRGRRAKARAGPNSTRRSATRAEAIGMGRTRISPRITLYTKGLNVTTFIGALLFIIGLGIPYATVIRPWLKKQVWVQGFFEKIEAIETTLFKKSETVLVGRLVWLSSFVVTAYDFIAEFVKSLDLTPLTTRIFDMLHIPPDMRGLAASSFLMGLGLLMVRLRKTTTKPLALVAAPEDPAPAVQAALAQADVAKEQAVAAVKAGA